MHGSHTPTSHSLHPHLTNLNMVTAALVDVQYKMLPPLSACLFNPTPPTNNYMITAALLTVTFTVLPLLSVRLFTPHPTNLK